MLINIHDFINIFLTKNTPDCGFSHKVVKYSSTTVLQNFTVPVSKNTHKCSKKSKIGRVISALECQCKDETNRCNSKHHQYPFTITETVSHISN